MKKRRFAFSMSLTYVPSSRTSANRLRRAATRDPDSVEADPAVVHAVEAHLETVVLDGDAGADLAGLVIALADRDDERVHALTLTADLELGEDDRELGVHRGVADVVLPRVLAGRLHDELLRFGVVRRDGADGLHVRPVTGLGHREAAHQLAGDELGQVGVVVGLGAELEDGAAEQAELDAHLHQDGQVAVGQRLERRQRGADVATAAVLRREAHAGLAGRGHLDDDVLDPLAEVMVAERLRLLEDRGVLGQVGADQVADAGVLTVEERPQRRYVDGGRDTLLRGRLVRGRSSLGRHGARLLRAFRWSSPEELQRRRCRDLRSDGWNPTRRTQLPATAYGFRHARSARGSTSDYGRAKNLGVIQ